MQTVLEQRRRQPRPGDNSLSFSAGKQVSTASLFGTQSAEDQKVMRLAVMQDPLTGAFSSFDDHVHTLSVCCVVAEHHNHFASYRLRLQSEQFALLLRGFSFGFDAGKVFVQPCCKLVSLRYSRQEKHRANAV